MGKWSIILIVLLFIIILILPPGIANCQGEDGLPEYYQPCFSAICHDKEEWNIRHRGINANIEDCSVCHSPMAGKTTEGSSVPPGQIARVHEIVPLLRGSFSLCITCHPTGMQTNSQNPNLDCLKCHGYGKKADVHLYITEEDNHDRGKNRHPSLPSTGHEYCGNCHQMHGGSIAIGGHLDGLHGIDPKADCGLICHEWP